MHYLQAFMTNREMYDHNFGVLFHHDIGIGLQFIAFRFHNDSSH